MEWTWHYGRHGLVAKVGKPYRAKIEAAVDASLLIYLSIKLVEYAWYEVL